MTVSQHTLLEIVYIIIRNMKYVSTTTVVYFGMNGM